MRLPEKPTSGSWAGDALALLEMGATSIDAATVRGLLDELSALHRRAQKAESEAIATPRRFEGALRDVARRYWHADRKVTQWKKLVRAGVEQIRAANVPDHHGSGKDQSHRFTRTGQLSVMIDRALAQRDPSHEQCGVAIAQRDNEIQQLRDWLSNFRRELARLGRRQCWQCNAWLAVQDECACRMGRE
jgi:hypothetical protein